MNQSSASNPFREGLNRTRAVDPCVFVLFGANGDLAHRKILPAIAHLAHHGLLPSSFSILGVGLEDLTDDAFRDQLRPALEDAENSDTRVIDALLEGIFFQKFGEPKDLAERLSSIDKARGTRGNRTFYLSTPPSAFSSIVTYLGGVRNSPEGKTGTHRIILEKPFGRTLDSARALNKELLTVFQEEEIYRIDHFLGKETVQNLQVLRFANSIFEPLWNRRYVDHVQITVSESLGVEDRAGSYYEESGALRDMIQNHLLQLLCLVAMEPPAGFDAESMRDERRKVLRSIRPPSHDEVPLMTARGQYGAGSIGGEKVVGYPDEKGVKPGSTTETFAAWRVKVENWRWAGVPFFLRTGKRLPRKLTEIAVRFRGIPYHLFDDAGSQEDMNANVLALRIQPDEGVSLRFGSKVPGFDVRIRPVKMDFQYGSSFGEELPEAYERLLLDALLNDPTLFIRGDVAEDAWKLVMPILEVWENTKPEFPNYEAGSLGPASANELMGRDGREWRRL